jgi:Zn-dependent protease with chaperone function
MRFVPKPLVETADVSRGRQTWKSRVKGLVSALVVLAVAYFTLGGLGWLLASFIPDRWERQVFGDLVREGLAESANLGDNRRPLEILERLTDGQHLRDLEYRLVILDLEDPNAFAFPGGTIGVTTGLLAQVETDAGLAFVLAHELGHHQHRHILKSMGRRLVLGLVAALVFDADAIRSVSAATDLAESRHSREHEREADRFALECASRVYGASDDLLEFFRLAEAGQGEPEWQAYFGSHPLTRDRLEFLSLELSSMGVGTQGPAP